MRGRSFGHAVTALNGSGIASRRWGLSLALDDGDGLSGRLFEGRRRVKVWKEALEPIGMSVVKKIGLELCNGPSETNCSS